MTKVYELRRRFAAFFQTRYCGVVVEMPFVMGQGSSGNYRSEFVVSDKFTQDAVEHDPRFGHDFFLAATINDEGEEKAVEVKTPVQEKPVVRHYTQAELDAMAKGDTEPKEEPKPKAKKSKKTAKPEVKTFSNVNDAIYYMENELGVEVDEDNIDAQLKEHNLAVEV